MSWARRSAVCKVCHVSIVFTISDFEKKKFHWRHYHNSWRNLSSSKIKFTVHSRIILKFSLTIHSRYGNGCEQTSDLPCHVHTIASHHVCIFLLQDGASCDICLIHCRIYEISLFLWGHITFSVQLFRKKIKCRFSLFFKNMDNLISVIAHKNDL